MGLPSLPLPSRWPEHPDGEIQTALRAQNASLYSCAGGPGDAAAPPSATEAIETRTGSSGRRHRVAHSPHHRPHCLLRHRLRREALRRDGRRLRGGGPRRKTTQVQGAVPASAAQILVRRRRFRLGFAARWAQTDPIFQVTDLRHSPEDTSGHALNVEPVASALPPTCELVATTPVCCGQKTDCDSIVICLDKVLRFYSINWQKLPLIEAHS